MSEARSWPRQRYNHVPEPAEAARLAALVYPFGVNEASNVCDPSVIADKLGIDVRFMPMLPESQSMLLANRPHAKIAIGGFAIVCNYDIFKKQPPDLEALPERAKLPEPIKQLFLQTLFNFGIAHELAHTFFHDWQPHKQPYQIPERLFPYGRENDEEEDFCDDFAESLLLPGASAEQAAWI
jgi:hypothetical protein